MKKEGIRMGAFLFVFPCNIKGYSNVLCVAPLSRIVVKEL